MCTQRKSDLAKLVERAKNQGWTVELRRGNHWAFFPADKSKTPVFTGSTPSDHRGIKNLTSQLRRSGLDVS